MATAKKRQKYGHVGRPSWLRGVYAGEGAPPEHDEFTWKKLAKYAKGSEFFAMKNMTNTAIILDHDPRWSGKIKWNQHSSETEVHGERVTDEIESEISMWIFRHYGYEPALTVTSNAVRVVAARHPYHPVRDYLTRLKWDGTPRLDKMLQDLVGVVEAPLNAALGRKWALSCVARVMVPGCKVDTVIILVGPQGSLKSSFLEVMAVDKEWFSDSLIDMRNKDAYQVLQGVWIYELAEMYSTKRSDNSAVKAYLASKKDRFRRSYGRNTEVIHRQTVFVGSTNETEFLTDPTGARRFWPVRVGKIDLAETRLQRDQLWAEALVAYKNKEQWWLTADEAQELSDESERYHQADPWEEPIREYLIGMRLTTTSELLTKAIERDKGSQHRGDQMRMAGILARLGWTKCRRRVDNERKWVWVRRDG